MDSRKLSFLMNKSIPDGSNISETSKSFVIERRRTLPKIIWYQTAPVRDLIDFIFELPAHLTFGQNWNYSANYINLPVYFEEKKRCAPFYSWWKRLWTYAKTRMEKFKIKQLECFIFSPLFILSGRFIFFSFPAENSFIIIIIIGGGDVWQVVLSKETGIFSNEQKTNLQEYLIGSSERKK